MALLEPVSVANLRKLAACPAAERWHPSGSAISLRMVIMDILLCCDKDGKLHSNWCEERDGTRGRRYSKAGDMKQEHFAEVKRRGANPSLIGRSLFVLPKYIRNMAHSEIKGMWILDLVNAHPTIMHRRHPSLQYLAHYVEHREEVLGTIPCDRSTAKELFIRLLYGGCAATWCQESGVHYQDLPPFIAGFGSLRTCAGSSSSMAAVRVSIR